MTARSSERASSRWLNDLETSIEDAIAESRMFTPPNALKDCDWVTHKQSVRIERIGETNWNDDARAMSMRFVAKMPVNGRWTTLDAVAVIRALDLMRFVDLSATRGLAVAYGVEKTAPPPPPRESGSGGDDDDESGSGESGSGGSGSGEFPDDGLPIDDEDRYQKPAPRRVSTIVSPVRPEVDGGDLEHALGKCLRRHVDRFLNAALSRVDKCVALLYLAAHTSTTMDRVSEVLEKKHSCNAPALSPTDPATTPTASTESELTTESDRLDEVTETYNNGNDLGIGEKEKKSSGGLQLALYIVIGLVSLALVVLAINLVIFGIKRRQLRSAAVAAKPPAAANNLYSTKIQLEEDEKASVKLDSDATTSPPRAGGVENQWSGDEEDESSLEEKA